MNKKTEQYFIIGGAALLLIAIIKMGRAAYYTVTDWLIPQFEGFRATPYWDYKQYTWGFGTKAPGPTGTITRAQALKEMRAYLDNDYKFLSGRITRQLNANQWAALLSFSYNLGRGNALNLLANINSGNDIALAKQWALYVNAGGVSSPALVDRRAAEWSVWTGSF